MPVEIEVTYRVVTPLFCAGADSTHSEIRLPSFKGVLRFWWRALAWSRCRADLEAIRRQEDALFGSAGGGQSCVSMRLAPDCFYALQSTPIRVPVKGDPCSSTVSFEQAFQGMSFGEGARTTWCCRCYGGTLSWLRSQEKHLVRQNGQLTRACLPCTVRFHCTRMRCRETG